MAATVTGTFKILDRASRPMRDMRREAERLDKSLASTGDKMDGLGTPKQLQQWDDADKKLRDVDRTTRQLGADNNSSLSRTRRNVRGLGDDSDKLSYRLGRLAAAFSGVQKVIGLMKIPLLVTGVVVLVQAIGALGGGLISLIPNLTDTLGLLGTMPAALAGVGLAAITAKLAFGGMERALKGTKGAMKELTPEARSFVRELKALKPIKNELRSAAQAGLFPGLGEALSDLTSNRSVGVAKRLLRGMGQTLGDTAAQAAQAFTQPGFLRDFEGVGRQGEHLMSRLGSALINVAHALMDVAVSAEPFTHWLSETIQGWSVGTREAANFGRKTGALREYFDRSRHSLELFGSIAHNLWDTFRGLGKAARPLGESLWGSADKATEHWAHFANSLAGQAKLRDYFEGLQESLHAIFGLVGELSKAFIDMSSGTGLAETARNLTHAIEPLEAVFKTLGESYGPALSRTVEQLVRLFANLGGGSSVLLRVVEMFNMLLEGVNGLLEKVPALSNLFVGVLGAMALRSLGARLQKLAADWGLVAQSAETATVAQREAAVVAGGVGTSGVVRRSAAAPREPIIGSTVPLVGRGGRVYNTGEPWGGKFGSTRMAPTSRLGKLTTALPWLAGAGGAARGALGAVGRFLWPIAAFMGLTSFLTAKGDFGERLQGGLNGATFGLIPGPVSDTQRRTDAVQEEQEHVAQVLRGTPHTRPGVRKAISELRRRRQNLAGDQGEKTVATRFGPASIDTHNDIGDTARQKVLSKQIKLLTKEAADDARRMGATASMEFLQAWHIYAKQGGAQKAAAETLDPISHRLKVFSERDAPQAARLFGDSMLKVLQTAKHRNPELADEYHKLEVRIERSFERMGQTVAVVNGKIYTGSASEWEKIEQAIGNRAELARERTSKAFTAMQQEAVGSLVAMGYTRSQATKIVQGMEEGGAKGRNARHDATLGPAGNNQRPSVNEHNFNKAHGYGATGMRIPGVGRQDTVPLVMGMAAPGELIVNNWTEDDVDRDLRGAGKPTLGERVAGERRRHDSYATGGRARASGGGGGRAWRGISAAGVHQGAREVAEAIMGHFPGLQATSTISGGHVSGSYHYLGEAVDISGSDPEMFAASKWIEKSGLYRQLTEGIHNPNLSVSNGRNVPSSFYSEVWAGHKDHIHVAVAHEVGKLMGLSGGAATAAGMAMMGGQPVHLKRRKSGLGGAPGGVADAAMGAMATGLERKINQQVGGGYGGPLAPAGGSRSAVERQIAQVLFSHGANKIGAAGVIGNAWRESKMEPDSEGTGGGGLWGFTSGAISLANLKAAGGRNWTSPFFQTQFMLAHGGQGLIPALNAAGSPEAAAALFMNQWERPGIPALPEREAGARVAFRQGYDLGGRIPSFAGWFGTGGTVTAHSPTLIGIGDSGTETAKITHGSGGGNDRPITVTIGQIHNHRPGDIAKQVKEEVGQALKELSDDLDHDYDASEVLV